MNNKWLMAFPLIILALTGIYILPAMAYTTMTFNDSIWETVSTIAGENDYNSSPPYMRTVQHTTGKWVTVGIDDSDSDNIHIYIYSATGTALANIDTGYTCQGGLSVINLDANSVLVCQGKSGDSGVYWFTVNVSSFAVGARVNADMSGMSGGEATRRISNILYNPTNGRYYVLAIARGFSGGTGYSVLYYQVAGGTGGQIVKATSATTDINYQIFGFFDTTSQMGYFSMTVSGTYHLFQFSVAGGTITDIATSPFAGGTPSSDQCTSTALEANFVNYYGGGIMVDGTDYYVYNAWSFSSRTGTYIGAPWTAGVRYAETWFWYIKFAGSISAGTLANNTRIYDYHLDGSGSTGLSAGMSCGYLFHNSASKTFDINTYYQDIYAGKYVSRSTNSITDLTTLPTAFDTETILRGCDDLDFDYISYDAFVAMNHVYGWSTHSISKTNTKLSIGGPILAKIYTFTGSYSPADVPMVTGTVYTFTWTVYVNGVIDNLGEQYKIYIDGVERGSGNIATSTGTVVSSFTFSSVKDYTILVSVYNTGVLQDTSPAFLYTLTAGSGGGSTVPDTPTLTASYAYLFTGYIPIVFVVLGPILMLGMLGSKMGGAGAMVGMLIGAIVGVIAGVNTSILPSYTIYLVALGVVAGLVVFAKMGGGGGGA